MDRITLSNLEAVVRRINTACRTPQSPYELVGKHYVSQVGCYHLSGAYGGYALHQMVNDGGGVRDVFGGHISKRDLWNRMHSFLQGIEAAATTNHKGE